MTPGKRRSVRCLGRSHPAMLLALVACFIIAAGHASAAASAASTAPLMAIERVGVPFPSWSSPSNGERSSESNLSPHLARASLLQPRFHRFLRYGEPQDAKTQTAIFVAGRAQEDEDTGVAGARVVSALNPRNGQIVWRTVFNQLDPVLSMHLASDILVTLSGSKDVRVSMLHGPTGQTLWSYVMPNATAAHKTGLVDAVLIPPASIPAPSSSGTQAIAPDVVAMDRAGALVRLAGLNGHPVWIRDPISVPGDNAEQVIPLLLHATAKVTYMVSLVPRQRGLHLFSASEKYSIRVQIFSTINGASLGEFAVSSADVEMTSTSSKHDTAGNVVVIGQDAHDGPAIAPHLVWLQTGGTVRSVRLPQTSEELSQPLQAEKSLKPKTASRFTSLIELRQLGSRGFLAAQTDTDRGEVLRYRPKEGKIMSQNEFEEDAKDAVYAGALDRRGMPYVNRIFFSRGQHLLNFHVLWADAYEGEGQVTGFSFQYDHDLSGDVLAAPFEVSPISDFQLITRAVFVTESSSLRMVQEDKHQWIREEGLSHTTASIMIDLPERKLGAGTGRDAKLILQGESFPHRLQRHALELQSLPAFIEASILSAIREIPNLSLSSFGIGGQRRPSTSSSAEDAKKPAPTPQKKGALPFAGVGAQKVQLPGQGDKKRARHQMPAGVPPVNKARSSATTPVGTKPEEPAQLPYLAPREANKTVVNGLVRDKFGFRKLIVATSKKGKIYAVDGLSGSMIWEKSLVGFGQGEGDDIPKVDVKFLALTRPVAGSGADVGLTAAQGGNDTLHAPSAQLDYDGLLTVVAVIKIGGVRVTRMWEIEPLTGRFPGGTEAQTGIILFPEAPKDVFLLPVEDERTGQVATAAIRSNDDIFVWPTTPSITQRFADVSSNFFYAVQSQVKSGSGSMRALITGYSTAAATQIKGLPVWRLPLPEGEDIVSMTRSTTDPVASQGKVLGDRQTLYKYLNPHLLVVLTKNNATKSASLYIVDGVRGNVLHQAKLCSGNLVLHEDDGVAVKPEAVLTENWLVVKFDVLVGKDDEHARYKGEHRQTRLLSLELYEPQDDDAKRWQWSNIFSSFGGAAKRRVAKPKATNNAQSSKSGASTASPRVRDANVLVYSQVYVLPHRLRTFAATRTKKGISSKALVMATQDGRLQVLTRRAIDPRQPVGRKPTQQEMEEYLMPYDPILKDSGKFFLGGRRVPMPQRIHTKSSQLESTSVVFVDQSLDWFVTTVAPSGSFDLLSASFNKPQLLLTIFVLTLGYYVTKPMLASKSLRMRW